MSAPSHGDRREALELLREADQIVADILDVVLTDWARHLDDEGDPVRPELLDARKRWQQARDVFARALARAGHDATLRLADIDSSVLASTTTDLNTERTRGFQRHVAEVFWELRRGPPPLDDVPPLPDHEATELAHAGPMELRARRAPGQLLVVVSVFGLFAFMFLRTTCG